MAWFLYHLDLLAIAIAPLNTETREYSPLLDSQQACQPVNLLDVHAASQSSCCWFKTLIKKVPSMEPGSSQTSFPPPLVFFLIGPHVFSLSFSALRVFQAHPFPAELKYCSDKKHH